MRHAAKFYLAVAAMLMLPALPVAAQERKPEEATLALPAVNLAFTLAYLAEDLHLWEKHGVKIGEREIAGLGATNAVIAGSVEFALASGATLTRAAARGQRLVAIAELIARPVSQVILRKSIAEAAGFEPAAPLLQRALVLKGHSIAVGGVNTVQHAYVRLLAIRAGYDPEAITIAPLAPGSMIAAFEAGQVDGFVETVPWPQQPVLAGKAVLVASGPDGEPPDMVPFANTVLLTKPETCEKRRALCEALGHSLSEADDFLFTHPVEALAYTKARFTTFDEKLLAASLDVIREMTPRPPLVGARDLENTDRFNVEAGLLKPDEKLTSYDGLFNNAFVQ